MGLRGGWSNTSKSGWQAGCVVGQLPPQLAPDLAVRWLDFNAEIRHGGEA